MKKLMTVLASAATALFAFGDGDTPTFSPHGTGFEVGYTEQNRVFNPQNDDSNSDAGSKYWFSTAAAGEVGDISNHAESVSFPSVPDMYSTDTDNRQYLHIDASAPLFRSAVANTQSGSFTGVDIGGGIYLDTLVQFTAADDEFQPGSLAEGDKIAISYVEHDAVLGNDDEVVEPGYTNFVIRAGQIVQGSLIQNNYFAAVPAGFNKEDWHRLTVRSIKLSENQAAFVIYLDGDPNKALAYPTSVDAGFDTPLNGVAANYYNAEKHALYPSAVGTGDNITKISAASFSGTGALDDVVFTDTKPSFINEGVIATFVADTGVTGISVQAGEAAPIAVDMTASTLVAELPAQASSFTVTATVDTDAGYQFVSIVYGSTTNTTNGATISGYTSGNIEIHAARNNFNVFDAAGHAISGTFATLSDALAAEGVAKIQLAYNYDVAANETVSDSTPVYVISKNIVLDLNGKTLNGGSSNARLLFSTDLYCVLTVIDSVEGDAGKIVYGGTYGTFGGQGDIYIGSTELTDYGVVVDGSLCGVEFGYVSEVVRGKFLASGNTTNGKFVYFKDEDELLNIKSTAKLVGDYWVVTYDGEQPPQPTTYTLTIPEVTGATAVAKINGTEVTDLTKIASNAEVVVTWTAANGYKITAGATETITMSENKTAATPTVVAITYATLTITQVENCTIVVSNATEEVASGTTFDVADNVTLTVYRTPAEGYKLANGCAATEEIVMSEDRLVTASVEQDSEKTYPSYIEGDTAKGKYDEWAAYAKISESDFPDAEGTNKDAYLLNCKPSEVADAKAAFKFTAFDPKNPKDVKNVSTGYNERTWNGEVVIKQYSDVGCKTESATGTFFRAVLQ